MSVIRTFWGVALAACTLGGVAFGSTFEKRPAALVPDFLTALEQVAHGQRAHVNATGVQLWVDAMVQKGIDPSFLSRRMSKARYRRSDPFAQYRTVALEVFPAETRPLERTAGEPFALHAYRFDVEEDYDDSTNDDIYCYFITTHDDKVWGKATSIYRNLDEGSSFFFSAEDRGLFGPKGDKIVPINHTIVDFGIIESDGEDIVQLKKLSDVIVDLAVKALDIYNPAAGLAAEQARAEVKNLLHLVIEMDGDDHLVTDSMYFTPDSMTGLLQDATFKEFDRYYDQETTFSHFAYRLHFRLMR